jgi:Rrf2 family transcriptional repressor of oqxAB
MIDLRFPTALQLVLSLAFAAEIGQRCTSSGLALGLGANPSLVRKLLVPLARDGIVVASLGKNGGVRLGRPAGRITLRDVYQSVMEGKRVLAPRDDVPSLCLVSTNIGKLFEMISREAESALLSALNGRTIADSLEELRQLNQQQPAALKTPKSVQLGKDGN